MLAVVEDTNFKLVLAGDRGRLRCKPRSSDAGSGKSSAEAGPWPDDGALRVTVASTEIPRRKTLCFRSRP